MSFEQSTQTEAQKKKFVELTTSDPRRLVSKFAVPSIITMLISGLYNIVDSFYVGRIDTQSTAALGIVFSYMALIQAVAFFFGQGSGNFMSRALGRKDIGGASRMAAVGLVSAMAAGCVIAVCCAIGIRPLLHFLGSTDTILPYAVNYFKWILLGTPFIIGCFALNNQMRQQGNAFFSMIGIGTGAVLNIAIDPIFIFTMDMGVSGAGLATFISQVTSFFILLALSGRNGGVKVDVKMFRPSLDMYREIAAGGLPSLARQGLGAVSAILLNQFASGYGDASVAAFSIVGRVMMFAGSAMIGYGQGFQPVCGFNYGAKLYGRVKTAFWSSVCVSTVYCAIIAAAGILAAPWVIRLFRADDAEVITMGTEILRWQCASFPVVGFSVITNMFLQNIRKTVPAIIAAGARQGLVLIPVLFIVTHFLGFRGLEASQFISDIISFFISIPLGLVALRGMKSTAE